MGINLLGGEKLQAHLRGIKEKLASASGVRMGFLEGSHAGKGNAASAPEVALFLEMGTSTMPPRPFFQETIDASREGWRKDAGDLVRKNNFDMKTAMGELGEVMAGNLRDHMREFTTPGDKPETIRRKGFDDVLIDSGNLLNAVNHEVMP